MFLVIGEAQRLAGAGKGIEGGKERRRVPCRGRLPCELVLRASGRVCVPRNL